MSFHILMTCKLILLTTDFRLAYLTTTWYIHFRCLIVISNCYVKNGRPGASLVVQWLRSQLYKGLNSIMVESSHHHLTSLWLKAICPYIMCWLRYCTDCNDWGTAPKMLATNLTKLLDVTSSLLVKKDRETSWVRSEGKDQANSEGQVWMKVLVA